MPDGSTVVSFVATALVLLLLPGPAVIYIVTRSIGQGRGAGFASVLGIATGTLVHVLAATLGLSAILVSSAVAFSVVKYTGAAYLLYLGVKRLRSRAPVGDLEVARGRTLRSIFAQGVVVNLLNPKAALFFFSFLPQFVDPARGSVPFQIAALGCTFTVVALVSDGMYALLASSAAKRLVARPGFARLERRVSGSAYLSLGVYAALSSTRRAAT